MMTVAMMTAAVTTTKSHPALAGPLHTRSARADEKLNLSNNLLTLENTSMPSSQSSNKRPPTSVPGVKILITAASVAATVGGWALLSAKETLPVIQPQSTSVIMPQKSLVIRTIDLAPIPTLVPPPAQSAIVPAWQPAATSNTRQAVAPAPAPAAPALPALRVVSAPSPSSGGGGGGGSVGSAPAPAPVTTTHSSK